MILVKLPGLNLLQAQTLLSPLVEKYDFEFRDSYRLAATKADKIHAYYDPDNGDLTVETLPEEVTLDDINAIWLD